MLDRRSPDYPSDRQERIQARVNEYRCGEISEAMLGAFLSCYGLKGREIEEEVRLAGTRRAA